MHSGFPWLAGLGRADAGHWSWRRVPRVSLIPAEPAPLVTRRVLLLAIVLVAELLVVQYLYRDQAFWSDRVRIAQSDLQAIESRTSNEFETVSDNETMILVLDQQIQELEGQADRVESAFEELTAGRTDWGAALEAIFAVDGPEVRLNSAVTHPGGELELNGGVTGVTGIGVFQAHMQSVAEVLDLVSLKSEAGDSGLVFTADLRVR